MIYGKTIQNGEPTPEKPVSVQGLYVGKTQEEFIHFLKTNAVKQQEDMLNGRYEITLKDGTIYYVTYDQFLRITDYRKE